jgi:shikimate dehydrogenase
LGSGIAHSLSPHIHEAWGRTYHIPLTYSLFDTTLSNLPTALPALIEKGVVGLNVTMPLKAAVLDHVTQQDPLVKRSGAANTLLIKDPKNITAYNTDFIALQGLLQQHKVTADKRVVILGAGAVARTAMCAFQDQGIQEITVVARDIDKVSAMAKESVRVLSWSSMPLALQGTDWLINATPVGMHGVAAAKLPFHLMNPGACFLDAVYHPWQTAFLQQARQQGLTTIDGLDFLLRQAQASFHLWFGLQPVIFHDLRQRVEGVTH